MTLILLKFIIHGYLKNESSYQNNLIHSQRSGLTSHLKRVHTRCCCENSAWNMGAAAAELTPKRDLKVATPGGYNNTDLYYLPIMVELV